MSFLEEVADIVTERGKFYGPPSKHWSKTAKMWTVLLSDSLTPGAALTSQDVARMFIADKMVRDTHTPRRDNLLDIAGYAAGLDRIRGLDRRSDGSSVQEVRGNGVPLRRYGLPGGGPRI